MDGNGNGLADVGGFVTLLASVGMNIWDMIAQNVNIVVLLLTSIGGLIYLYYRIVEKKVRIQNEKKKSRLLDLEIKTKENEQSQDS